MSWTFAAIVGGAVSGLVLLVAGIGFIWLYLCRGLSNKTSEIGSSNPSTLVEWNKGSQISSSGCAPEHQEIRQFSLEELELATQKFSESNIVGVGSFGVVSRGCFWMVQLLQLKDANEPRGWNLLKRLLQRIDDAGPSQASISDIF